MSTVLDIINTRSSIRKYSSRPVEEEICRTLIEAGLKAPTAANKQEIHISVATADDFKWSAVDAGIAVENMHLAAADLGLGSVILGCMERILNGEKKAYFDEKLSIPEGYSFLVAIAAGYPETAKEPHTYDFDRNVSILK